MHSLSAGDSPYMLSTMLSSMLYALIHALHCICFPYDLLHSTSFAICHLLSCIAALLSMLSALCNQSSSHLHSYLYSISSRLLSSYLYCSRYPLVILIRSKRIHRNLRLSLGLFMSAGTYNIYILLRYREKVDESEDRLLIGGRRGSRKERARR